MVNPGILLYLIYKLLIFNGINIVIFYIYNLYVIIFMNSVKIKIVRECLLDEFKRNCWFKY